jgi:transcription antitermination factor NusG
MPLLKRGTEIFPQEIFAMRADSPWWVANTRSRQEKELVRYLLPRGVPFYLPNDEKTVRRAKRTFVSYPPLFPGYVFFRGGLAERQTVLRSHLLVRVLEVGDQELLNQELAQLRSLQLSGMPLVPLPEFEPGDAVQILHGPFQGYTGVVVRGQARPRLVISITMLRKTVAVELERDVVVPLASPLSVPRNSRSAVA